MTEEEKTDRLKMWLDMMKPEDESFNEFVLENIKNEGLTFVPVTAETAPPLNRKLGRVVVGPNGMSVHVQAHEDDVRLESGWIAMLAEEAVESLKRTVFKDDLYRANGLEWNNV